jgi:hypothetical protein
MLILITGLDIGKANKNPRISQMRDCFEDNLGYVYIELKKQIY